jgi:selenide,water dikinase
MNAATRLRVAQPLNRFWDELVHDPQTSGGLLIAVASEAAESFLTRLSDAGVVHASRVGEVRAAAQPFVELRGE